MLALNWWTRNVPTFNLIDLKEAPSSDLLDYLAGPTADFDNDIYSRFFECEGLLKGLTPLNRFSGHEDILRNTLIWAPKNTISGPLAEEICRLLDATGGSNNSLHSAGSSTVA